MRLKALEKFAAFKMPNITSWSHEAPVINKTIPAVGGMPNTNFKPYTSKLGTPQKSMWRRAKAEGRMAKRWAYKNPLKTAAGVGAAGMASYGMLKD